MLLEEIFIASIPVDPKKPHAHSWKDHLIACALREIIGYLIWHAARDPQKKRFAFPSIGDIALHCINPKTGKPYSERWVQEWLRIAEAQGWIVRDTAWRNGPRLGWYVKECPRPAGTLVCCCALKAVAASEPASPLPPGIQADIQTETIAQLRAENAQLRAVIQPIFELRKVLAASPISLPSSPPSSAPLHPPLHPPPGSFSPQPTESLGVADADQSGAFKPFNLSTSKSIPVYMEKQVDFDLEKAEAKKAKRSEEVSDQTLAWVRRCGSWPDIRRQDTEAFIERRAAQLIANAGGQPIAARSITRPEVYDRLHEFFALTGIQPRSLREADLAGAVLMANTWADEYGKTRDPARLGEMLSKCMSRYKPLEIRWPKVTLKLWGAIMERGDHPLCRGAGAAPEPEDRCDA
jgi:hypothetical protein